MLYEVITYKKFPKHLHNRKVIIVDPMLATGHSGVAAVDFVKNAGAKDIKFMVV